MKQFNERFILQSADIYFNFLTRQANKWGISERQLYMAIIETGDVDIEHIKKYFDDKGEIPYTYNWIKKKIIKAVQYLHMNDTDKVQANSIKLSGNISH